MGSTPCPSPKPRYQQKARIFKITQTGPRSSTAFCVCTGEEQFRPRPKLRQLLSQEQPIHGSTPATQKELGMLSVRPSSVRLTICLVPAIALSCTATSALAQCGNHQWISASDKAASDQFGSSITAFENLIVI